jgi:hypothetical protein
MNEESRVEQARVRAADAEGMRQQAEESRPEQTQLTSADAEGKRQQPEESRAEQARLMEADDEGSLVERARFTAADDEELLVERARVMEAAAEGMRREAEEAAADPAAQEEWIRQSNLIYGGLAAAGLVVVQPFLSAGPLDLPATVCVIAFAVSIPLLAALLVLNRQEEFRRRTSRSRLVALAKAVAQGSAFVGITGAFWHISTAAGIVFLAMGFIATGVHSSGFVRLEYDSTFRSRFRRNNTP